MGASAAFASDGAADEPTTAAELAASLADGDPTSLGLLYDDYSARLYTYACGLLRDQQLAADAVHDTILVAYERIEQLRDPSKLTAWLYAICRNECHRIHRRSRREGLVDDVPELSIAQQAVAGSRDDELDAGIDAAEARSLVERALPALSTGDREIVELSLRHGLDSDAVARVRGVNVNNARARMSRARASLEQAIGALLVLESPTECSQLTRDIGEVDGRQSELTALSRKRIVRHLKGCAKCSAVRRKAVCAIAMVTLPLLIAPIWLREGTLGEELVAAPTADADPASAALHDQASANAGDIQPNASVAYVAPDSTIRFDRHGWPRSGSRKSGRALIAVGAAAILVALGTGGVAYADGSLGGLSQLAVDQPTTRVAAPPNAASPTSGGDETATALGGPTNPQGPPGANDVQQPPQAPDSGRPDSGEPASAGSDSSGSDSSEDTTTDAASDTAASTTVAPESGTSGQGASNGGQAIDTGPPTGWTPPASTTGGGSGSGTTATAPTTKPTSKPSTSKPTTSKPTSKPKPSTSKSTTSTKKFGSSTSTSGTVNSE